MGDIQLYFWLQKKKKRKAIFWIIDGEIKMCESVVKKICVWIHVGHLSWVNKRMLWNKQTNTKQWSSFKVALSSLGPSLQWLILTGLCFFFFSPLCISWKQKHVDDLRRASEDHIALSQLKAGGIYPTLCYCSAVRWQAVDAESTKTPPPAER